jgi:hypothetical protein
VDEGDHEWGAPRFAELDREFLAVYGARLRPKRRPSSSSRWSPNGSTPTTVEQRSESDPTHRSSRRRALIEAGNPVVVPLNRSHPYPLIEAKRARLVAGVNTEADPPQSSLVRPPTRP